MSKNVQACYGGAKTKPRGVASGLLFCLFPRCPLTNDTHLQTDGADQREALTANFSVSLAKCGVLNTARKICQIDACVNFVNLRVSLAPPVEFEA